MRGLMILASVLFIMASASATPRDAPGSATASTSQEIPALKLEANPPAIPHEPPIQEFDSPDGALVVWVAEGHGGVVLSVTYKNKHELASDGHYPDERPGGFGFAQGGWTADSQYFVYSTGAWGDSLSAQPIFSIYVYSRTKNAFLDLGSRVGLLGTAQFELTPPDVIGIQVVDSAAHATKKVTMRLSDFVRNIKIQATISRE